MVHLGPVKTPNKEKEIRRSDYKEGWSGKKKKELELMFWIESTFVVVFNNNFK